MDSQQKSDGFDRQRWLGLLARAHDEELDNAWDRLRVVPTFDRLRAPETGLVMVRGRAGGTGQRFNLGEMTVTRASIRLADGTVGAGYVAGRNRARTERVAVFDALLQAGRDVAVLVALLERIAVRLQAARQQTSARAARTRVDFATLAREVS